MKKISAVLLSLMLCLSMAACNMDLTKLVDEGSDVSSSQTEKTTDADDNNKEEETTEAKKEITQKQDVSFEEVVVMDNDECLIKITEIDDDSFFGYTLKAYIENKSEEKSYTCTIENAALNGVQATTFLLADVASGKKANEDFSFSKTEIDEYGLDSITDIEVTFKVYESGNFLDEEVMYETVHVYPFGEENATEFVRETKDTDTVLIDNDDFTVIVTGYEHDKVWGYCANLFLVNKTDKDIRFSVEDASVNGYMADPYFYVSLTSGKCKFDSMSWSDTTLEENSIEEVEEIELTFRAYDADDFMADDIVNEEVKLVP